MVRAAVALVHLDRLRTRGERQQLVAQTDAEDRHVCFQQSLDDRHRIFARCRRIAGSVAQEDAIRLQSHHLVKAGLRRHHRHPRTSLHQIAEDVVLRTIVDRDHMRLGIARRAAIAFAQRPVAALPALVLVTGDADGEVHALQPRPLLRPLHQGRQVKLAVRRMGDHRVGRTGLADAAGQRAGVNAAETDLAVAHHPVGKRLDAPEA